jgi:hypothetical protein
MKITFYPALLAVSMMISGLLLINPTTAMGAPDVHYTLYIGDGLDYPTYQNPEAITIFKLATKPTLTAKFDALIVHGPTCSSARFANVQTLSAALNQKKRANLNTLYDTYPIGTDGWEAISLTSTGCSALGSDGVSVLNSIASSAGFGAVAIDFENVNFPTNIDVGASMTAYLTALGASPPGGNPPWIFYTGYPEKLANLTGQFFTFDSTGKRVTGLSILTPTVLAGLGHVMWQDLHTYFVEQGGTLNTVPLISQRIADLEAISGPQTTIQIGIACLLGLQNAVTKKHDQRTLSQSVWDGEEVMMAAFNQGVRQFNIYTTLGNMNTPQWKSFYSWLAVNSAKFPTAPNIAPKPYNRAGISYGVGCLQE